MIRRQLVGVAIALACALAATPASARHHTKHHHHSQRVHVASQPVATCMDNNGRYLPCQDSQPSQPMRYSKSHGTSTSSAQNIESTGSTISSVVNEARRYLGTNPTHMHRLWCGAFMDMVLKKTGHPGGGNLASAYAHYGQRVSGPQVGAIAVMGRRGGGHVGVVSGIDGNGNPIIISGNHNHTTAESVYPRGRIYAYVMPR